MKHLRLRIKGNRVFGVGALMVAFGLLLCIAEAHGQAGGPLPVFETLDLNADGRLSLQEFLADPQLNEPYFQRLDVNADTYVSKDEWPAPPDGTGGSGGTMTLEQTLSDQAQAMTIAFDALAFLTGDLCSDSFLPPGKVADFSGFQYLRDNDPTGLGHNTDFVTITAFNVLHILTESQVAALVSLAGVQVDQISAYGYMRFPLMDAFRRLMNNELPAGSTGLDLEAVKAYSADLYQLDGEISYGRAEVLGGIVRGLSLEQRAQLDALKGLNGVGNWDATITDPLAGLHLSQVENVAVMTYASEMYSWYAGSIDSDVYFCPERQGTYFGSFYMKDMPAMGNPDYTIPENLTGDMGNALLGKLTPTQASLVTSLVETQRADLLGIVAARTAIATQLRHFMMESSVDKATVLSLAEEYGRLDGAIVYHYATNFAAVHASLSAAQQTQIVALREEWNALPCAGAYLYSEPVSMPAITNTDFLFGVGTQEGEAVFEGESSFVLHSSEVADHGSLPAEFTCDGASDTLPLDWSGAPVGTASFAVIMHHEAPDMTKWYWILYDIPGDVTSLALNTSGVGTLGNNSVNGLAQFEPPCSQGPGEKTYIYTVYALSAAPTITVAPEAVSREVLLAAMQGLILGTAELQVVYARPEATEGESATLTEGEGESLLSDEGETEGEEVVVDEGEADGEGEGESTVDTKAFVGCSASGTIGSGRSGGDALFLGMVALILAGIGSRRSLPCTDSGTKTSTSGMSDDV